jgi:hypothetical protein
MICPECREAGLTSVVTEGFGSTTAVYFPPFHDEAGRYHYHDGNATVVSFSCSRGHSWRETLPPASCWCGWPAVSAAPLEPTETFVVTA